MGVFIGVIIGLIALTVLVVLHEIGHAYQAKRCGVVIEEFGIGLPPAVWKKKLKNGITFSINWLMFGGFVKLKGEYDEAKKKGDYGASTFLQKTKILFAGVTANWIAAAILLTFLSLFGMPKILSNQFYLKNDASTITKPVEAVSVSSGSAADKAGIKSGDYIIKFNNTKVKTDEQLLDLLDENKGKSVSILYRRNGTDYKTQVNLGTNITKGYLGVGLGQRQYIRSTWSAPIVGIVTTAQFTWETLGGLGNMLVNLSTSIAEKFSPDKNVRDNGSEKLKNVGDSVAGPIGIIGTIFPAASHAGFAQIILLTAVISISLAVMNILPIPALDGGRWITMAIFKLFRKKLTIKREESIQTFGFLVMMGLIILVTILDVKKLF